MFELPMRTADNVTDLRRTRNSPPLIDSPAVAAQLLCDYFLANADRGDNAANDELVAEMVRRIRELGKAGL